MALGAKILEILHLKTRMSQFRKCGRKRAPISGRQGRVDQSMVPISTAQRTEALEEAGDDLLLRQVAVEAVGDQGFGSHANERWPAAATQFARLGKANRLSQQFVPRTSKPVPKTQDCCNEDVGLAHFEFLESADVQIGTFCQ